ncbi:hypothetical protein LAZ67_1005452 [Cordylochernes scorpioides]|uniref:Gag-pol polyprotein n=1 Tax=Cordylochernes scorpioides TaxID=51811 RepID=A0ABY6JZY3_9ARAC|nr:hypothetical protein LAZ67_1005452 [Cordylochernes scorpioides]
MLNINSKINVNTTIGSITRDIDFYSSDIDLPYVLLSLHHIRLFKLDIDFQSFTITQFGRILNVNYHNPNNNNCTHHNVIPLFKSIIPPDENDFRNFNSVEFDEKLSPYEKSDLIKLIKENKEAFAAHKMDIGHIKADPIRIKLTSQTPISLKPFRPSFSDNIEIKRQIEELLKYNVIRPSYSSYASPAMLVNKRNEGKTTMVIHSSKLRPYYPKEGFELKLTKSKIPTLEKKPSQQVAPKRLYENLALNTHFLISQEAIGTKHIFGRSGYSLLHADERQQRETQPLSVEVRPSKLTVDAGSTAIFNCTVRGGPAAVEWARDLTPLRPSTRIRTGPSSLEIGPVARSDRGMFQCRAYGERGSAQDSAQLSIGEKARRSCTFHHVYRDSENNSENITMTFIEDAKDNQMVQSHQQLSFTLSEPLSVEVRPSKLTVDAGSTAIFNCTVRGGPAAVEWARDLTPLRPSARIRTGPTSLEIGPVARSDRGMFQCRAYGERGSAQDSAQLSIGGETIRLEIMGEELKEIKEKIEKLYDELFSLDEVDIDKESEAYDGSMNKIGSLRVKIENERKLKDKLADIKLNGSQANIKLPQFDLPIYDGDMGNWINFKELFLTTIDAHPGLTNIQKLQYLNSAVKGEAARLIRGFPLLSENYGQAWSTLLSRYDNPRELAYAQVSKIFSLRAIRNPSAKCLHEFMDVCNEAIRNLETLELKRNQFVDVILVHFLQQKLSENLRLDWELSMDNTLPSYDKFIAFISRHARSMSCAVKECSKREETTGSRFPKCQSYGMLIEKSDTCILCKSKHHPLYMCNLFCKMPLKEKLNVVKGHKLCFNCLRKGHFSWNCRLNQRCKVCKGKHHTMIHYDKPSTEGASAQVENTTPKEHESAINLTNTQQANCNDSHVLLATARIKIKNGLGKLCTCRALLDSGSQVTMITKGCCERLGLVQRKSDRMIIGVGNTPVQHSSSTVGVTFCPLNNSEEFSVEAVVTGVLTSEIPNFRLKDPNWPTLKSLKLADPEFYIQAPIDMILGADIYTELMLNGPISLGEGLPMAINTRLGWVLLGKLMGTSESNTEVCNLSLQSEPELEFVLKRFWETESVPSPDLCTQDEDCERLFSNNHGRDSHGRYWVKLPFRQHRPLLGESREKALRRFLSLEGKLCKNVKLYDQYRGFMKEYEHLNHMERVPIAEVKRELCRCYYMPHHPVIREQSTTTKMRVVFDASAKSENNVSLNQFLHKGPKIQQDVFFILLRFRTYPVAITADIEKMYRQIRIHPEDADYQRILWRPSPEEPVVDYRLLTVTYGTTSAPFLAMRTLQQLAEDEGHNYPEASRVTLNDFYVDDLLTGAQTIAETKELIDQLKDLMKKGGFHLRKWNSNCQEIVSHVEEMNEEKKINLEKGAISKILGSVWDHVQDTFRVNITLPEEVVTKRDLLSNIARIFDPLGFLSPTTVALKIIMQELWRGGIGWDEHIPNDIKEKWNNFRAELLKLGELSIPRYVWACEGDRDVQLHGFCDASSVAYSAVCYLRTVSLDGQVHISMLAAKTRVAPCKSLTLPRLELCAALLLSQLYRSVVDSLKIDIGRTYLWSDSQISLSWIKSDLNRWKTFIHNRVVKIQQLSDRNSWRHVSGKDNPADCASRGIMPAALSGHTLWWQGPTWLKDNNFVQNQDNCYGRECHEEKK